MNTKTTRANVCTTPTPPLATGTIAQGYVAFYVEQQAKAQESSDQLYSLFAKRKCSPVREALWDGYWSLRELAAHYAESLNRNGGLLFAGRPAAVRAAKDLEAVRKDCRATQGGAA